MTLISPQTPLDLTLIVRTMLTQRRVYLGRDGVRAMEALREANDAPLTVSVHLTNRVDGQEVLVYEVADRDGMPRWTANRLGVLPNSNVLPFPSPNPRRPYLEEAQRRRETEGGDRYHRIIVDEVDQ